MFGAPVSTFLLLQIRILRVLLRVLLWRLSPLLFGCIYVHILLLQYHTRTMYDYLLRLMSSSRNSMGYFWGRRPRLITLFASSATSQGRAGVG